MNTIGIICDVQLRKLMATWLQQVMIDVQDPGGSWFDYPLYGYGHAYGTAYGILVLQSCNRVLAAPEKVAITSVPDAGSSRPRGR